MNCQIGGIEREHSKLANIHSVQGGNNGVKVSNLGRVRFRGVFQCIGSCSKVGANFVKKWDFKIVNFGKSDIFKMWIFAPVWKQFMYFHSA